MLKVLAVAGFEALGAHAEVDVGRAVRREHDREFAQRIGGIGGVEDAARAGLVQPRAIAVVDRVLEGPLTVQPAIAAVPAPAAALEIDREPARVALVNVELVGRCVGRAARAVSACDGFPSGSIRGCGLIGVCDRWPTCRRTAVPRALKSSSYAFSRCGMSCWGYLPGHYSIGTVRGGVHRCIGQCISRPAATPDDVAAGRGHNRSAPPMGGGARAFTGIDRVPCAMARVL